MNAHMGEAVMESRCAPKKFGPQRLPLLYGVVNDPPSALLPAK